MIRCYLQECFVAATMMHHQFCSMNCSWPYCAWVVFLSLLSVSDRSDTILKINSFLLKSARRISVLATKSSGCHVQAELSKAPLSGLRALFSKGYYAHLSLHCGCLALLPSPLYSSFWSEDICLLLFLSSSYHRSWHIMVSVSVCFEWGSYLMNN